MRIIVLSCAIILAVLVTGCKFKCDYECWDSVLSEYVEDTTTVTAANEDEATEECEDDIETDPDCYCNSCELDM